MPPAAAIATITESHIPPLACLRGRGQIETAHPPGRRLFHHPSQPLCRPGECGGTGGNGARRQLRSAAGIVRAGPPFAAGPGPPASIARPATTWPLVDLGHTLVSADARLPNGLLAESLTAGELPPFSDFPNVRREVTYGESRLDLMLEGPPGKCYLETKSVTLVEDDGMALFPRRSHYPGREAPAHPCPGLPPRDTGPAWSSWCSVAMPRSLVPHDTADPEFGVALRDAKAAGVEVRALLLLSYPPRKSGWPTRFRWRCEGGP